MKILIYILCYNEETQAHAEKEYADKPWAKVVFNVTTPYLENIMYGSWLMDHYDEWKDVDYVGTLSWKASQKIKVPQIDGWAQQLEEVKPDVVPFYLVRHQLLAQAKACHPRFEQIWVAWLQQLGYTDAQARDPRIPLFFCNYWMARPEWMLRYIEFFRKAQTILDTYEPIQEDLWSDARYTEIPSTEKCMAIYGKPYYPYHSFLCERLPCAFFWMERAHMAVLGRR